MPVVAILLAAGSGERLGYPTPKAFVGFRGQPMLLASLATLARHPQIDSIVVVAPAAYLATTRSLTRAWPKVRSVVSGGATRLVSLRRGLRSVKGADFILVHNAANPNVSAREITQVLAAAQKFFAAGVGSYATATVKKILQGKVVATLPREEIFLMETPQVVRFSTLQAGLRQAQKQKIAITDDLQLAELVGVAPVLVPASEANRKITTRQDLLALQNCAYRVGCGQDSHPFFSGKRSLVLAGLRLSASGGLAGNSDGDVILHALVNALSSAIAGGSISTYADALCARGVRDSRKYLKQVLVKLRQANCEIVNVSIALEAAKPKLEKHFLRLKNSLAQLMSISTEAIGMTVTTGEGLTAFGRGEGMQCFVFVLLRQCR